MVARRGSTATSNFGVGRRESHDASAFYARFTPPVFSGDDAVATHHPVEPLMIGDARDMAELPDGCVALVVTSPPYYAGKAYEEDLGQGHVPGSYLEYLTVLRAVFAECVRVLEPGGRIAVNVANLGRRPYRSLAADVLHILQDDLHLLLRGEIVWQKARGAGGSCAWGTFASARNPVLRDVTERVIVAGKGRLDRARTPQQRADEALPHLDTITNDEYLQATLDVWEMPPERATLVDHPAPFPVELPQRLIELYTFEGDLVLDPFLGSGSTAVAAARTGRRWVGYDTEPAYVETARRRVAAEVSSLGLDPFVAEAAERGQSMGDLATAALEEAGFVEVSTRPTTVRGLGIKVARTALDASGQRWWFDLTGGFTTPRTGLLRTDTALAALGRAAALRGTGCDRVVLLTSWLPPARSGLSRTLQAPGPDVVFDAVEVLDPAGRARLAAYATGEAKQPLPGFWPDATLF
jgi:site-specific DNA-methyltransferase (adenine-specific)